MDWLSLAFDKLSSLSNLRESSETVVWLFALSAGGLGIWKKVHFWQRFSAWRAARGLPDEEARWPKALTSRFVGRRSEMGEVLEIRRRVFEQVLHKPLVSGDESYWACFERNKQVFKLVGEAGMPFGYWGVLPVSRASFEAFLAGKVSHSEMLTEHCLSWQDTDPTGLYLYYVGIVSLSTEALEEREPHLLRMEAKVIQDAMASMAVLASLAQIKGIAVYASTKFGARLSERKLIENGFRPTGVFASEDRITEILLLDEPQIAPFFEAIRVKYLPKASFEGGAWRAGGLLPFWPQEEAKALAAALKPR